MRQLCIVSILSSSLCISCIVIAQEGVSPGDDYAVIISGGLKLGIFHGRSQQTADEKTKTWQIHDILKYVNPVDGRTVLIEARVTTREDHRIVSGVVTRRAGDSVIEISIKQDGDTFIRSTTRRGRTRTRSTEAPDGVRYFSLAFRRLRQLKLAQAGDHEDLVYMVADNVVREMKISVGAKAARRDFAAVDNRPVVVPVDIFLRRHAEDKYKLTQRVDLSPDDGRLVWGPPVTAGGLTYSIRRATKDNWDKQFPPAAEKVKEMLEPNK